MAFSPLKIFGIYANPNKQVIHSINPTYKFTPPMKMASHNPIMNSVYGESERYLDKYLFQNIIYMNAFSDNESSVKIIFDPINFKIVCISNYVKSFLGYNAAEILEMNLFSMIHSFKDDLSFTPLLFLNWFKGFISRAANPFTDASISCCGLQIKHKQGYSMRVLVRYKVFERDPNGLPKTAVITVNNISHLMKEPFYWGRMVSEAHQQHFISKNKQYLSQDIVSVREKDVLYFLAQGLSSKEIAEKLFISAHTVDHHRRNMIARTGLRDTTALLQIMHMIGVI
jgi:DNA-binding CsgD family transcriptional regulator